jgi:16S rRNA (guanine(966)-N(2))-methyltransferase RsmD
LDVIPFPVTATFHTSSKPLPVISIAAIVPIEGLSMRIIAGKYRGRRLKTLRGLEVRPTSDRLRETLFNIIRADVPGSVFIDCYAGSGAVGLEALSRDAAEVYLIEQSAPAVHIIEQNIAALDISSDCSGRASVLRADAKAGLRKLAGQGVRAHFCFLDPPYALLGEALKILSWVHASSLMHPGGLIILEHGSKNLPPEYVGGWSRRRLLLQGSSALSFYRKG